MAIGLVAGGLCQTVRPLEAMVTAIRIQWLPKSRNPASIGDDSRGNGTAGTESIASAVRAIANAVVISRLLAVAAALN